MPSGFLPAVDFESGELRNVARHGIVELPLSFFVQHHHRHAGDRLAHGVNAENRILLDRVILAHIELANGVEVHDLAVALDECDEAGDLLVVDETLHGSVQAAQPFRGHAHRFGPRGREIANTCLRNFGGSRRDGARPLSRGRQRERCGDEHREQSKRERAEPTCHKSPLECLIPGELRAVTWANDLTPSDEFYNNVL